MTKTYNFRGLSILIVDDNLFSCQTIGQMCFGFGFEKIIKMTDATEALEIFKTNNIDFVICDYNMKPINGTEFTRFVRTASDAPDPYVAIIMLTGNTEQSLVEQARDAGVTEFVSKPVSARSLLDRIIHIVEHPRPFVLGKRFTGPDRRRRIKNHSAAERRAGQFGKQTLDATESKE